MAKIVKGCFIEINTQQYRNGGAQMHDRWARKRVEMGRTNSDEIVNKCNNQRAKEFQKIKRK